MERNEFKFDNSLENPKVKVKVWIYHKRVVMKETWVGCIRCWIRMPIPGNLWSFVHDNIKFVRLVSTKILAKYLYDCKTKNLGITFSITNSKATVTISQFVAFQVFHIQQLNNFKTKMAIFVISQFLCPVKKSNQIVSGAQLVHYFKFVLKLQVGPEISFPAT